MAKKYKSRSEAFAVCASGDKINVEPGFIVDIIDEKFGDWMKHPVVVVEVRDGKVFGFECTSSQEPDSRYGKISLLDWKQEGFDDYCRHHTVKCDRVEAYDIENVVGKRGIATHREMERLIAENTRYCTYLGRGQTLQDAENLRSKQSARVNQLRAKAKVVIPTK